jgi:hypothetical protein
VTGRLLAAAGYHAAATARNRLRVRLRQLRSPRTLVAVLVGGTYIWWFLLRRSALDAGLGATGRGLPTALGALALALVIAKWWLAGADPRALAFTPAEMSMLFPAPVSRRALVQWKLWRAQGLLLVNTLLWAVILRGGAGGLLPGADAGALWRRGLALWLLFTTLYLHRLGSALRTAAWRADGGAARRRWWAAQAVVGTAVLAIAWNLAQARAALRDAWLYGGLGSFVTMLDRVLGDAPARWVLAVPRALLDAVRLAPTDAWERPLAVAAGLAAVHYAWVLLGADVPVHELALDAAERRGRRRAAPAGDVGGAPAAVERRPAPRLAPTGHPATAILWKNFVAAWRSPGLLRVLLLYAALAAGTLPLAARDPVMAELAMVLLAVWGTMLVLGGPLMVRTDLRQDLAHLALLRALPLRGRDLVGAEVLASSVALTLAQLAVLLVALGTSFGVRAGLGAAPEERVAIALALACALPAVNLGSFVIHNGAALLFPTWVRPAGAARGLEATGQGIVTTALVVALLTLLLALPAALAWGVLTVLRDALGLWAFAPAAVVLSAAAAVELVPVVGWLGRVFERMDPPEALAR